MSAGRAAPLPAVDSVDVRLAEGGFGATVRVRVDPAHPTLRGHFPGLPIYPGVFVVETLCQAMTRILGPQGRRPSLRTVHSLRLTAALTGGDELTLDVAATETAGGWRVKATGTRRDGAATGTVRATFTEGGPA